MTSLAGSSERRDCDALIELLAVHLILTAGLQVTLPRPESFLPQLNLKQAREAVIWPDLSLSLGAVPVRSTLSFRRRFSSYGV